ncbi:MAG: HEAT repeat domain-containing protein [Verrucomicrobiota bacterium JB023]|nr:HEAT repeat domain-containing protein [Verrucomicrobiota bacterium JB023]
MKPSLLVILTTICAPLAVEAAPKKKTQSQRAEVLSAEEQLKTFELPEGFEIELVASEENGLINPIDLSFDDAGRLWTQTARMYPMDPVPSKVGRRHLANMDPSAEPFEKMRRFYRLEKEGEDKILIIDDPTQPVEGTIPAFAEGLAIPQSILPYKTGAFVAHASEMLYLDDTDGDGKFDSHETVLSGFGIFDTHTMSHTLLRGPGGWVHFSHGALNKGEVEVVKTGQKEKINFSKIARFSLAGDKLEVLNNGLNNIWGFHLKDNGQWYGTEANDLGWSLVPLHPMMSYKGIGNDKFRDYQPIPPVFHKLRVGGTGISGLAYDENGSSGFPEEWKEGGFLANPITSTINFVVADRAPDGSVISKHMPDFLKCNDDWFRPVNIEFGPDGCLYVVDWYNKIVSHNEVSRTHPDRDKSHGRLWRIRHRSQTPREIPNLKTTATQDLVKHLQAEIQWERRAAWHQIADRQATELAPQLKELVLDTTQKLGTRVVALWSLESLNLFDQEVMRQLARDKDPDIRRETVRALSSLKPGVEAVVSLVEPLAEDPHYMVREQVLRTLAEIEEANQDSIRLLVSACVPGAKDNKWGGGYVANFRRFLARKALEQYPSQLVTFLQSPAASKIADAKIDWASKALEGSKQAKLFVENWKKGGRTLDAETLVSIAPQLNNPTVFELLKPEFGSKEFVQLALEVQPRLKSSHLHKALVPGLKKLMASSSPEDRELAIEAAIRFRTPVINNELREQIKVMALEDVDKQLVEALAIAPKKNEDILAALAGNEKVDQALRLDAAGRIFFSSPPKAAALTMELLEPLSTSERNSIVQGMAKTHQGSALVLKMIEKGLVTPESVELADGERILNLFPRLSGALELRPVIKQKAKEADAAANQRLANYQEAHAKLEGNPTVGQAIFSSCLACHAVGDQGFDIAPALDGSANRNVDHLLTAIVKPDEAMEGGYRLYRVVKKNGDILEGYLYRSNDYGVTLAFMGNGKIFVPREHIMKENIVYGRSFMPRHFGELPEQAMVDLIDYIQTLK